MSVATKFDRERCGGCCPPGLLAIRTITALVPYRQGLLPSVRVFIDHLVAEVPESGIDHLAAEVPKEVRM